MSACIEEDSPLLSLFSSAFQLPPLFLPHWAGMIHRENERERGWCTCTAPVLSSPSSITHTQTFHSKDLIIIFWRGAPFSLGSIPTMKLWRHSYFFPPPTGILVVFILHSSFVALTSCYGIACMNSARSFGIPPLCPYVVQQTSAFRTIFLQCSTKY